MTKKIGLLFAVMFIPAGNLFLSFAKEPVSKSFFGGVAIGGHDAVNYHESYQKQPDNNNHQRSVLEGSDKFIFNWKGAEWRFADEKSKEKFAADPDKYVPNYNGFCANALSIGEGLVKTDGDVWEFFGEQLYLFYSKGGRERWLNGDWKEFKKVADSEWEKLKKDS